MRTMEMALYYYKGFKVVCKGCARTAWRGAWRFARMLEGARLRKAAREFGAH